LKSLYDDVRSEKHFKKLVKLLAIAIRDKKVRSQAGFCDICGGQTDILLGFSSNNSVFSCHYYSAILHHSFDAFAKF